MAETEALRETLPALTVELGETEAEDMGLRETEAEDETEGEATIIELEPAQAPLLSAGATVTSE